MNEFPQVLKEVLEEAMPDVTYVDLTPGFQQRAHAGEMLYYPDDTHWNDAGHRAAADILAESLQRDQPTG